MRETKDVIWKPVFVVMALASLIVMMVGCTSTGGSTNASNDLASSLAIKYATLKVIEKSSDPQATAERIVEIADGATSLVDAGSVVLIPELEDRVRERIDFTGMDASKVLLIDALLMAVRMELEQRVTGGTIGAGTMLVVNRVLDDVVQAAELYAR